MLEIPKKEITVNVSDKVVLLDRLDPNKYSGTEVSRNIYRLDLAGNIMWQVFSRSDDKENPFTNIMEYDEKNIKGYRWGGGLYLIDLATGFAKPYILMK